VLGHLVTLSPCHLVIRRHLQAVLPLTVRTGRVAAKEQGPDGRASGASGAQGKEVAGLGAGRGGRGGAAPSRQGGVFALLLLFFCVLSLQYSCKALAPRADTRTANRSAILRWREQILDLANGADISLRYNSPNPPIMALLLYPLAQLSPLA